MHAIGNKYGVVKLHIKNVSSTQTEVPTDILMEDGNDLLLESGDVFFLES